MKKIRFKKRRFFALFLAFVLCVGSVDVSAFAVGPDESVEVVADLGGEISPADENDQTAGDDKSVEAIQTEGEATTPDGTEEPKVSEAPEVTEAPEASEESEATETPEASEEPEGTEAPEVSEESEATEAPEVSEEPEATEAPEVNEEPEATEAPKNEEIPAEVQAFLDAVAKLPAPEDVTKENAEEIGEQVNGAFELYDVLVDIDRGYEDREDVAEALEKAGAVFEAVGKALELEAATFGKIPTGVGTTDPNVLESAFLTFEMWNADHTISAVTVSGNYADADYVGEVLVNPDGKTATVDSGNLVFYTNYGIAVTTNWKENGGLPWVINRPEWLNVSLHADGGVLYVTFTAKPGAQVGQSGSVKLSYGASWAVVTDNAFFGEDNGKAIGDIYYKVTVGDGTVEPIEKPDAPNKDNVTLPYVFIQCQDSGDKTNHSAPAKLFYDGKTTIIPGEVIENTGRNSVFSKKVYPYECTVQLNGNFYLDLWNNALSDKLGTHMLYESPKDITFYYSVSEGKWKCPTSSLTEFSSPDTGATYGWLVKIKKGTQVPTYTVTYNDGVKGETVFTDQSYTGLKAGDNTPVFAAAQGTETVNGKVQPKRTGYTFMGWAPAVTEKVDGNVTYVATWEKAEKITDINKKLVESASEIPSGVTVDNITYPVNGEIVIPNGGSVKLLYKITVTGDVGAKYKVTDTGASWVSGPQLDVENTIPEGGSAVIYVTREFTAHDINENGKLVNIAMVTPGKDNESNTTSTETTPAKEEEPETKWRMKEVTIVKTFVGKGSNKIALDKVPGNFVLNYSYTYRDDASVTGKLVSGAAQKGTDENGHPTLTWKMNVKVDEDTNSTYETLLTITESNYNVGGYVWEKQVGLNGTNEKAVTGTYQINSTRNLPTNYIYNYYQKAPDAPNAPVIPGRQGNLRVKVVCDSNESGHKDENEKLRLRDVMNGITEYTGGEVVKTSKYGYDWEYTVTLYKSDFADRFTHNNKKDHEYKEGTKDTVNVTFYYKNGEWDFENLKTHNPGVEIVYEKNGDDNYFCNYVVYHVEPKTTTKTPEIEVKKSNAGFRSDPESGNAKVDYTVTITNKSGFDIYGLRLTDTLTPTLTKTGTGEGEASAAYTFSNWRVDGKDIAPKSGSAADMTHVLQLIERNTKFAQDQTVTLTYTVEIENTGKVETDVHLENKAEGASWSKAPSGQNPVATTFGTLFRASIMSSPDDDDPPDVTGSGSSSATTETDPPDVTDTDTSEAGGNIGGSTGGSSTEGTLPAKYTLTYEWNLPEGAVPEKTLPSDTLKSRPAGSHFTVDAVNKEGDEVTANGKIYVFSGWKVPDDINTETNEGQYKGQYVMPGHAVVIKGTWTLKETVPEKPTKEDLQQVGVVIKCVDDSKHDSGTEWWKLGGEDKDGVVVPWWDTWRTIGEVTKNGDTYQCVVTLHAVPWANMRINGQALTEIKEEKGIEHIFDEAKTGGKDVPVTFTYKDGKWTTETRIVEVWLKENIISFTVTVNHLSDNGHNFWTGYDPTYRLKVGETYDHSFDESMTTLQYPNKNDVKSPKAFNIGSEYHYVLDPMANNTPEDQLTGTMGKENVIINLYYSLDVKGGDDPTKPDGGPDGIPDKYQTRVTFKVVNGNWNNDTDADVVKYFVKYKEVDGKMVMAADGIAVLGDIIPSVGGKPDAGFKAGAWDTEPTATTEVKNDTIYTYTYVNDDSVTITIKYVDEEGNEIGSETKTVTSDEEYDVTEEVNKIPDGYEPNGEPTGDPVQGTADSDKLITVPVKKIVRYTVTYTDGVDDEEVFADQVTTDLKEGAETPAFNGTPSRTGYIFAGWNPEVADTVTGDVTYTAQWTPVDPTPVDPTPVDPTPVDPTPVDPTPVDPTPVDPTPVDPTPTEPTTPTQPATPATPVTPVTVATQPTTPVVTPVVVPVEPTAPAASVEPPVAQQPEVEIEENENPLAQPQQPEEESIPASIDIEDAPLPLAEGNGRAWALVNFALMNLAVFEALMLLIGYFVNTKKKEDERESQEKKRKKGLMRVISIPVAIISIIAFCLTEDISLPTGFVDRWTLLMAIIAIVQTIVVALSRKKEENEDEKMA